MAANGDQERNEQPQPQPPGVRPGGGGFTISGKTLGIAGGGAAALVAVIAVVVLLVTGAFGGGTSGGGEWLGYVPDDVAGVGILDNRAFHGGDVPEDFAEYYVDGGDGTWEKTYDFVDVDQDDLIIHATAIDGNFDETLEILQGNFDFDIIREELEDGRDCEDDDYRGFELWECPGQEYPAVALFERDKYVVLAAQRQEDLEDVLTYKSRDPEKLANANDSDIKRLIGQTDGWWQLALLEDFCPVNRCEGLAFALGESDDSADMPASYALLFTSERAATDAEGKIEIDDLLQEFYAGFDLDLDIGEVKAEGEFVVGSGTAEFVEPESGSSRSSEPARNTANRDTTLPDPDAIDWINYCYETGSVRVGVGECQCLYAYLQSNLRGGQVPRFSSSWEVGYGSEEEIDAMNACGMHVQEQTTGGSVGSTATPIPTYALPLSPTNTPVIRSTNTPIPEP